MTEVEDRHADGFGRRIDSWGSCQLVTEDTPSSRRGTGRSGQGPLWLRLQTWNKTWRWDATWVNYRPKVSVSTILACSIGVSVTTMLACVNNIVSRVFQVVARLFQLDVSWLLGCFRLWIGCSVWLLGYFRWLLGCFMCLLAGCKDWAISIPRKG